MKQTYSELVKDLNRGVMHLHPDVILSGDDLPLNQRGVTVFNNAQEVLAWTGLRIDPAYLQRLMQVDFTKSSVVGVAFGESFSGCKIELKSIRYNADTNEIDIKIIERTPGIKDTDPLVQSVSYPFMIFRFLKATGSKINVNI